MTRTSFLVVAALLPVVLSAPSILRRSCTPVGERCVGRSSRGKIASSSCCGGSDIQCVAHPDFESDPDSLGGRYCFPVATSEVSDARKPAAPDAPGVGYYPTAAAAVDSPMYGDEDTNVESGAQADDLPVTASPMTVSAEMSDYPTKIRITTAPETSRKATAAAPVTTTPPVATVDTDTDAVADPADVIVDDTDEEYDDDDAGTFSDGSSNEGDNPLAGMEMYVNPSFKADIDVSLASAADGAEKDNLAIMRNVPSAYWLDVKYKVTAGNDSTTESAEGIMKDAAAKSPAPLVSFIVYDLPNRDCHAKASNGEICCGKANADGTCDYLDNEGECASGLAEYKETYIDQLAVGIKKYCDKVPLALFIEPDSLPNLVTNTDDPKCGGAATQASYRQGITYAVKTLAEACPKATIYVDAAHGGWLGWPDNLKKFSEEIKGLGITEYIRGFSLNVANYQPVGVKCPAVGHCLNGMNADDACCTDPCGLAGEFNPAHSELNYAAALGPAMTEAMPGFVPHFVIDTGRNGKNPRTQCSNWCNVRGAGSGMLPTTKTGYPEAVDAYMWLKTPGESDGCTETLPTGGTCRRFDADCASVDSIGTNDGEPLAPEAGGWFDYQIKMLAKNADLFAGQSSMSPDLGSGLNETLDGAGLDVEDEEEDFGVSATPETDEDFALPSAEATPSLEDDEDDIVDGDGDGEDADAPVTVPPGMGDLPSRAPTTAVPASTLGDTTDAAVSTPRVTLAPTVFTRGAATAVPVSTRSGPTETALTTQVKTTSDNAQADDKDTYSDGSSSGGDNPLAGMEMYVNPSFKADIDVSLASAADGAEKDNLAIMRNVPSAYWLDVKYKVTAGNDSTTESAEGIMKDAAAKSPAPLVSFIVYDLPNRDCHAKASNGEICCGKANADGTCDYLDNEGECASGLAEYKETYIDQLAVGIKKYCDKVPLALFIEPDSLPNLVTNTDDPKCGGAATQASYRQGITYAVKTLAEACPKATIYVDAAHGGWLGWPDNLKKFSEEIKGLGITEYIRGFSLNVANYQPVGVKCPAVGHCLNGMNADDACCTDPCGLAGEFNPAHSELNYAAALGPAMTEAMPGFVPHFVIDTGRNGKNPRTQCSNWCNVRGAGSGMLPTTKTGYPEAVDAYMWLKTPGESDGCTETLPTGGTCRRFDADCASVDSIGTNDGEPLAPEAGGWFDYQIKMLAQNADLYAGSS